jgi:hypothetical protein
LTAEVKRITHSLKELRKEKKRGRNVWRVLRRGEQGGRKQQRT